MNAEEARAVAIHNASLEIAGIQTKLDEALKNGDLSISVRTISEAARSYFRENGYTVKWDKSPYGYSYGEAWKISCDRKQIADFSKEDILELIEKVKNARESI